MCKWCFGHTDSSNIGCRQRNGTDESKRYTNEVFDGKTDEKEWAEHGCANDVLDHTDRQQQHRLQAKRRKQTSQKDTQMRCLMERRRTKENEPSMDVQMMFWTTQTDSSSIGRRQKTGTDESKRYTNEVFNGKTNKRELLSTRRSTLVLGGEYNRTLVSTLLAQLALC